MKIEFDIFSREFFRTLTFVFQEGGFYVECGALNGEKGSNSLFFEKVRKWNGLLIEADPSNYGVLKTKNRKALWPGELKTMLH
jgi:hypothetical protein